MTDQISLDELEKASTNVRRLSEFIGERRDWLLASDADEAAAALADAVHSLSDVIRDMAEIDDDDEPAVHQPTTLKASGRVTSPRLLKFAEFIDQLRGWFAEHNGSRLPEESDVVVTALLSSLAGAAAAIDRLRGPAAGTGAEPEPLVSGDLGPVAEVDMSARLVLEDTVARPLLQVFKGVTELTPAAMTLVDEFFAKQGIELKGAERRRFQDKALRWIKSTPDGQVLVVRLSGLSGKVEAYSSYRPKGS